MHFKRAFFGLMFGLLFGFVSGIGNVTAQNLSQSAGPKELPPSSYKGRQYVDSSGCVFVRAGYDNNVTWVPRVSKNRKLICGFKPTFPTAGKMAAAKPPAQPKATTPPKPAKAPKPAKPVVVARPAQPVVKAPAVKSQPQVIYRTVSNPPTSKPSSKPAASAPREVQKPVRAVVKPVGKPRAPLVLFPAAPRKVAQPRLAVTLTAPAPAPKVAPVPLRVPKGYRRAFDDDRLNPRRGKGTALGDAQMALVWTNEVPRRLVTEVKKRPQRAVRVVRVSTKSLPKRVVATAASAAKGTGAASHRYIQVGVFAEPGNARSSVIKLQRLNLPVRMGRLNRKGKTLKVVLAGPFASQRELDYALGATRRAGFVDSFLRK